MKKYLEILKTVELFRDIDPVDLESLLNCVRTEIKDLRKNEIVLLAGDMPRYTGIVLSGMLHIIRETYDGSRSLISAISPGEIFAETLCCAGVTESPVTVIADSDSTVMLLSFRRILHTCPNSCNFHTKMIENMLTIIAGKNLHLQGRMEIIGLKSIRAKVMRYLESFIPDQGRNITIPFSREELADFLCAERSALSHELARMKQDGLIDYKMNRFTLLQN